MKKYVGIRLDHREAFILSMTKNQPAFSADKEMIEYIDANIESRIRRSRRVSEKSALFAC